MSERLTLTSISAGRTRHLGASLGHALRPGDVVVLDGDLGAGKTTFTQGIAVGMGIDDPVTSPTFVVAREMNEGRSGTALLHVDAYRIGSVQEWDDLDLDLASFATVVEWGQYVAVALPRDRLEIRFTGHDEVRELSVRAHGPRSMTLLAALEVER